VRRLRPYPASREILEKIRERHGLEFEEVEELFARPRLVLRGGEDAYGEVRYKTLGRSASGRYILAVYAAAAEGLAKVITAREMSEAERDWYRRCRRGKS